MNTLSRNLIAAIVAVLIAGNVHASLVLVGPLNPDPDNASPAKELEAIQEQYAGNDDLLYFQRWNTSGNSGSFAESPGIGSYTFNPPGNVSTMDITWDLTSTLYELAYVLVKGGQVWNLYSVTADQVKDSLGPQSIYVESDGNPKVSHVSFFGVRSTAVVPEPGTIAVWGLLAVTGYFGMKKWHAKA
jgi:hypothetical protein